MRIPSTGRTHARPVFLGVIIRGREHVFKVELSKATATALRTMSTCPTVWLRNDGSGPMYDDAPNDGISYSPLQFLAEKWRIFAETPQAVG